MSSSESESEDNEFLDQQIALQTAALTAILNEIDFLLHRMQQIKEIIDIHFILQEKIKTWEFNTTGSQIFLYGNAISVYEAVVEAIKSDTNFKK